MKRFQTIYLVDNDSSALKGLTKLLTVAGYNVEAFSSSEDFFQIQSLDTNACLIIDVWELGIMGVDLTTFFVQKNVTIPIIFLSAGDENQSRKKARAVQAAGFFRKPVDGPALLDAITWAIDTHSRGFTPKEMTWMDVLHEKDKKYRSVAAHD